MGSKVREINERFKNFMLEVPGIGLIRMEDSMRQADAMATAGVAAGRQTNSLPLEFVTGRDREESEIVALLKSKEASVSVSVLSIYGMGGLGKTTLAKSIYNHPGIDSHFGRKIWVCVSDKFEVTELFRLIFESLRGKEVGKPAQDVIVRNIREELAGKRFLLVLDDVWNEDRKLWEDFFTSLVGLNTASGSCCLVTTRSKKTAHLVSTFDPFALDKLADDECWSIICRRATEDGEMPQQLNVHREPILRKCEGLPLAANAVGGLLSLQKREDWLSIIEDKILKVGEYIEGEILPIMKLSFDCLPSLSIKKCFAYCSIYAKDQWMEGKQLVELWMAEGFLQEGDERITMMEEVGRNYLAVLLQSSLLEKVKWGDDYYQMHDLVHDLAECVSKREQIDADVRHLALTSWCTRYNASSTLVQILEDDISDEVIQRHKRLHVLVLCGPKTKNLPNDIGKLKHLRHLDVSYSAIEVLPESLCKLYNLQTLKLIGCGSLPQGLSSLISLRHLYIDKKDCNFKMPPNMGHLTGLQTLSVFNVGEEKGCEIKELGSMKNLKGTVKIHNLELVKGKEEARLANVSEKQQLVGLKLCWGSADRLDLGSRNDEHVLEGLEPHPKLQKLKLENYTGARLPQWFGKLTALTDLGFINCKSLEAVNGPVFPKLKALSILDCCKLASVPTSFPSLEALGIRGNIQVSVVRDIMSSRVSLLKALLIGSMGWLNSFADVIVNHLTCLERLYISDCDNLIDIPSSTLECCTSLKMLKVERCPNLKSCALNLQQTPSLSYLWFEDCPNMFTANAMPRGFNYLTNLTDLSIGPFTDDSIQLFDWSGLILSSSSTLQHLEWSGSLQKHSNLPQQLQHFTSLVQLSLISLNSVEALPDWLGNLTSLQALVLRDCPKLQYLPSAHAMARLTNLRNLYIYKCPLLPESPNLDISSLPNLTICRDESWM